MSDLGNKKVMSRNIKRLLEKQNKTRYDLSKGTKINYNTISSWIQGKSYPRIDKIEKMANYFKVPKSELVESHLTNTQLITNIIQVPVVGTIAMGTPITAEENIEGYVPEYFTGDAPDGTLFELHCRGRSMEPTIPDGALALIRQQPDVEDDEIAAVLIDGEATLKRIQHAGNQLILMPDNKSYSSIVLNKDNPGRILGKLIRYTKDF